MLAVVNIVIVMFHNSSYYIMCFVDMHLFPRHRTAVKTGFVFCSQLNIPMDLSPFPVSSFGTDSLRLPRLFAYLTGLIL